MSIRFDTITPDNWRIFTNLQVKEDQKKFVLSNEGILARAFAFREYNSQVHAIYNEDKAIGMLMQYDYKVNEKLSCVLNEFMIAKEYQGNGYSKLALELWLSMIKNQKQYDSIILTFIEGNEIAYKLYLEMGFSVVEQDENEIIMEYGLK